MAPRLKPAFEGEYLFPLLKSSDIGNGRTIPRKSVILTQTNVKSETDNIEKNAPKLWKYLNRHSNILDNRKSSIYKKNGYDFLINDFRNHFG